MAPLLRVAHQKSVCTSPLPDTYHVLSPSRILLHVVVCESCILYAWLFGDCSAFFTNYMDVNSKWPITVRWAIKYIKTNKCTQVYESTLYILTRQIHIEWQSKHNYVYVIYKVYIQTSQPTTCFGLFQLGHLQVGHTVYLLHVPATHVTIFREMNYNG